MSSNPVGRLANRYASVRPGHFVLFAGSAHFPIVVPEHEEDWHGVPDESEVVALGEILLGGEFAGASVFVGHERVAEVDQKIGRIGEAVQQGASRSFGSTLLSR